MNKIYTIYKAVNNFDNKCYIGFTSCWPKRLIQHKSSTSKKITIFSKAIKKYGWENFSWEILYQSKNRDHTLEVMEPFFIKECKSHFKDGNGYNMNFGGIAPREETKEKISQTLTGISRENSGTFKKGHVGWNKGIPIREESRKKLIESKKESKHPFSYKLRVTDKFGVRDFSSTKDFADTRPDVSYDKIQNLIKCFINCPNFQPKNSPKNITNNCWKGCDDVVKIERIGRNG